MIKKCCFYNLCFYKYLCKNVLYAGKNILELLFRFYSHIPLYLQREPNKKNKKLRDLFRLSKYSIYPKLTADIILLFYQECHCVKSVQIRSFFWLVFSRIRKNTVCVSFTLFFCNIVACLKKKIKK